MQHPVYNSEIRHNLCFPPLSKNVLPWKLPLEWLICIREHKSGSDMMPGGFSLSVSYDFCPWNLWKEQIADPVHTLPVFEYPIAHDSEADF